MRVIVTRAAAQAQSLVDALRREGFEPVLCPLIEIEPVDDGPIDVSGYDWVIVTSAAGAEQLAQRRVGSLPRVAAIGAATANVLATHGVTVDFVPSVASQEGLVVEFPRPAGRALFVGAEEARGLIAAGLDADVRVVYRTRRLRPERPPEGELVLLASPSAAEAFAALGTGIPAITIGPQTTAAAHELGIEVRAQARTPDVNGLLGAVRDAAG